MKISDNTQAILLLTAHFSGKHQGDIKPLAPKEWGRFARWLSERSISPSDLLTDSAALVLSEWADRTVTVDRLVALLARGPALALAMEKWLRAGLWVMTRADPDYPGRLKKRLGYDSPAVLFGCGNRALVGGGGLAVVGSRNAGETDLAYSRGLGALTAASGNAVISGGARGVDEAAMLGALEVEGTAVGVLSSQLLRASSGATFRPFLMKNDLALISPFNPDARFQVGNAMQRNKYIYCLADGAFAVHSGQKGGTWTGGMENLRRGWVPLWVKRSDDPAAGNAALVHAGAAWAPERADQIRFGDLFSPEAAGMSTSPGLFESSTARVSSEVRESAEPVEETASVTALESSPTPEPAFYEFFSSRVEALCTDEPRTRVELMESLELKRNQLDECLRRAVAEKSLTKLRNPVRYQWSTCKQQSLLD